MGAAPLSGWRLQTGRVQPFAHASGCFGLPRLADELLTLRAGRRVAGLPAQTFSFLRKTFIERIGLLEAAIRDGVIAPVPPRAD